MAESIIYGAISNIVSKLGSPAVRELGLLWGVNEELEKLDDTLSAIQAVLLDAEEELSHSHRGKHWVSRLKNVVYEIEDLMDECGYEALRAQVLANDTRRVTKQVRMLFSIFKRPSSNLKLAHKIKHIRERLKAIDDDKNQFSFSPNVLHTSLSGRHHQFKKERETFSFIHDEDVIGRDNDKDKIIESLLDTKTQEHIGVVSIVGMGGLGKTALTQSVYNDDRVTHYFELKLWVCVSEDFDVKIIVEKIIESATKKKSESFLQMDSLQSELRKQIDGKKYLLVMDDVWNEDNRKWESLKMLLVGGAKGSRILITTRSQKVADTHNTTFLHSLKNLNDADSWLLFKKMTLLEGQGEEFEDPNLIKIGKDIVTKLRGVPLVIRTIGRLLKENKSPKLWSSFKDKELSQVMEQVKNNDVDYMLSILELSYKHLPANLKQCFLYCALFPKDYEIEKDELILLWKAQGFIPPNDTNELIDIGEEYYLELLSKSFFQDVRKDERGNVNSCKMHDLMHDLACLIVKNECINGSNKNIDKKIHHLSLNWMSREESKELLKTLSKARNLRTFFILGGYQYHLVDWKSNLDKFFQDNSRLRTLKVHLNPIEKSFWSYICRLKHLRYLSIGSLDLKYLPTCFTKLYNLETLSLPYWSNLKKLPCDIKNLINLKHLDLSSNENLQFLPDSITELCKLEKLILSRCVNLKELPSDIQKLVDLKHLYLTFNLKLKFLPYSITQLCKLEELGLSSCKNLKELPHDIKKLVNLKHLCIRKCYSLRYMPKGLGELTNLQTLDEFVLGENFGAGLNELNGLNKLNGRLKIRNLQFFRDVDLQLKAKFLQQKSGLRKLGLKWYRSFNEPMVDVYERASDCLEPHSNLEDISIRGYKGVKLCNWLTSGSLGRLVRIRLVNCERLEHLPQFDQFPYLKILELNYLPNIDYIVNDDSISPSTFFQSLETLRILDMPKLKRWWKSRASTESKKPTGESFSIKFPILSKLEIEGCDVRILMSFQTLSLKVLSICDLKKHAIDEHEFDVVPFQNCENLSSLSLSDFSKLEYLPKCLQHVTTLQNLTLSRCTNLKSLPEWIDNLTSLTKLEIFWCEKLTSMPEGIGRLQRLISLHINGCPKLEERCKKDEGDDWPKIAHIPKVTLSYKRQ